MLEFGTTFRHLTDNDPFPWQRALYERLVADNLPDACNLPTGLGKTNTIAVWLIAGLNDWLNERTKIPRRLVYVVNRRTVVDQTTTEVENIRKKLETLEALPAERRTLAISTLRGQFADNRAWSADPSRPAVICGTVDMIGSRLLFSGYNVGFRGRPLQAGFLGQDALLIHDEAHLEPAFQELIETIQNEQHDRERSEAIPWPKLRVMALTATPRGGERIFPNDAERDQNEKDPTVQERIGARKTIALHPHKEPRKLAQDIADLLLTPRFKDSKRPILVFVRKVEDVETIVDRLHKADEKVQQLTGTLRGLERDQLVKDSIFGRFLPGAADHGETAYLVCTSAGEVGVNISADHLVCDLSTFESMAQRFGRVNRFGLLDDSEIHVFHPTEFSDKDPFDSRREKTLALLTRLNGDGSPKALGGLPQQDREAAFAPTPTILPATDILFDAWALTTIRDQLPGRPAVETYLHGISEYDPPQTTVAWREEVAELTPAILEHNRLDIEDVLEAYPLKPHELLSAPTEGKNKVFEQLQEIAQRNSEHEQSLFAWVIDPYGKARRHSLQALVEKNSQNRPVVALAGATVLLPPHAGGLKGGLLKGDEPYSESIRYDVSGEWSDPETKTPRRNRVWADDPDFERKRKGMRLICRIDLPAPEDAEDATPREWHWLALPASADDDGSKTSRLAISWQRHTDDVVAEATRLANSVLAGHPKLQNALILAARCHDHGKRRAQWQTDIGNDNYPAECYAKSGQLANGGRLRPRQIISFRHEFASLIDALTEPDFQALAGRTEIQDLVLHLIAAHHGYARPHFPADVAFDPEHADTDAIAAQVPQRFARLQRKYGRWGLAYLESLLRAADWHASAHPSEEKAS